MKAWLAKLSTRQKVLLGAALYLGTTILLLGVAGSQGKNDEFQAHGMAQPERSGPDLLSARHPSWRQ